MNQIKLMVFDMAGTTIKEDNVVYKTIHQTLSDNNIDISLEDVLKHGAGKEKLTAIKEILSMKKIKKEGLAEHIFESFKTDLEQNYNNYDIKVFNGTKPTFDALKVQDIKIALNTGYNRETATKLLKRVNLKVGQDIDTLVTADDVKKGRPHPDMIIKAMKDTGISSANYVVKIGDSVIDIEEGKSAKCKYTIGLTSGAQNADQLQTAQPDYIFDTIEEVLTIIK